MKSDSVPFAGYRVTNIFIGIAIIAKISCIFYVRESALNYFSCAASSVFRWFLPIFGLFHTLVFLPSVLA